MRQRNGTDPREETEADLKPKTEKERRQLVVAFVFFLQVTVIGTIGREEKRGRSQFRPAAFPVAREPTRRQ
jgi:hypothetical protein